MDRPNPSRRTLLHTGGVGVVTALAGCFGADDGTDENGDTRNGTDENGADDGTDENGADDGTDENGDADDDLLGRFELAGDGAEAFRGWVLPETPVAEGEDVTLVFQFDDFEHAASEDVPSFAGDREALVDPFDAEPEQLTGELRTGTGTIYTGEFDVDRTVAALEEVGWTPDDEYRGYTTLVGTTDDGAEVGMAVGSDAILQTGAYEAHLGARAGDLQRLETHNEDAALLFDLLPAGVRTAVSYHPGIDGLAINGEVETAYDGNAVERSVRVFVFESADEASIDRATGIIESGSGADELFTEERHGRVVMVEFQPTLGG